MPKPLRNLSAEARQTVPFFREELTSYFAVGLKLRTNPEESLRRAFNPSELKSACADVGVKWTDALRSSLRMAFGMYNATAERDRFPHLHLTAQEIERRRRNIKRMGLERARPFLTVHEIVEHEGGDKAKAFTRKARPADLRFLITRLAEIFTKAGADAEDLPELIRKSMKLAKQQADAYCAALGLSPILTALKPRHFTPSYDKEIRAILNRH